MKQLIGHSVSVAQHRFYALLARKVFRSKPVSSNANSRIELHFLCCHRHVMLLLWCIKSFCKFAGELFRIVLHDDGTLTQDDLGVFAKHINGVRLITKEEADVAMADILAPYPECGAHRESYLVGQKIFDVPLLAETETVLMMDADILFFRRPDEIIEWSRSPGRTVLCCRDVLTSYSNTIEDIERHFGMRVQDKINVGIFGFPPDILDLALAEKYLADEDNVIDPERRWWLEQTIYAMATADMDIRYLPLDKYMIPQKKEDFYGDAVALHYVRPIRGDFCRHGVKRLLGVI